METGQQKNINHRVNKKRGQVAAQTQAGQRTNLNMNKANRGRMKSMIQARQQLSNSYMVNTLRWYLTNTLMKAMEHNPRQQGQDQAWTPPKQTWCATLPGPNGWHLEVREGQGLQGP